ncbi:P-loop containing nucleoside triphosphate hydrolase protein [Suhomyces tanzawaensis NRRL Y-17324]|uniref:ATP-dependent DNA helicase n=1 Tax=Suhomyces tanzawaensis NRRL Y-17324 TaxID=984487 RepID=A0A1E4SEB8_9ASCO|nr:P-loop containing nucleoside triphosphate hydrolase protein [Suhomyces tanzawaensis NRRL Y-17324]ODV77820.1 P-loop containing nucleoside triphosphate hydrolase protein [Suhomyces tanzawaensis NRRL Y-17324]
MGSPVLDEGDSVFDNEDDPDLESMLTSSRRYLPQRTLDGLVSAADTSERLPLAPAPKPALNIPTHHTLSPAELGTYIYPTNFEVRDYQYNVVRRAFYDNLLVALPTGLGKTFIASTVMLNFYRWFPVSKIVFMAPTKPLVAQQIKACCSITGLPSSDVAILLDKTRKNRGDIWDSKRVFFTTPQVVENDLASGIVDPKSISLLVIDESHRAKGNYAYNNVVKFLNRFNKSFRILALTATPASDVEGVQEIIDNLLISKVEVRTERSIDIIKYMKRKKVERRLIGQSPEILECIDLLCTAIEPVLKTANERKIYEMTDPLKINFFHCMDASKRLVMNKSIPEGLKWSNFFILQLLGVVGQCFKRLNIYGLRSFFHYFNEKYTEFTSKWSKKKSKNKLAADFYLSDLIRMLIDRSKKFLDDPDVFSHPKIEALMEELQEFFEDGVQKDSKVIIFTEFRDSALEIVQSIERFDRGLKPHIFIGQAKEKDRFDEENVGKTKKKGKGKGKKTEIDELGPSTRTSSEDAQIKGMNQKLQKEIIKKFKGGEYNILVATSIGEEGLDIGEVDLIVCYDSTSSPIKNIQRMGRTGRKRDGKVVLLFSGNEETKFDKAMGGYEYIQQHIMKGNLITLAARNRIIPDEYEPQVVEKFIDLPDENLEINSVDDEDEIIKIATQYMIGKSKSKKSKASSTAKQKKRFNMPDDVETGFRSVTSMLQADNTDLGVHKPLEKDLLDKILDSDSEPDVEAPQNAQDYSYTGKLNSANSPSKSKTDVEQFPQNSDQTEPVIPDDSDEFSSDEELDRMLGMGHTKSNTKSSISAQEARISETNVDDPLPSTRLKRAPEYSQKHTRNKGSLGVKKPKPNDILAQIKQQHMKQKQYTDLEVDIDLELPDYEVSRVNSIKESDSNNPSLHTSDEEEMFDDGLDEELALISEDNLNSKSNTQISAPVSQTSVHPEIFKTEFGPLEGLLNEEEQIELYTSYFTTIPPEEQITHFDPSHGIHQSPGQKKTASHGRIGHSKTTNLLLNM